MQVQFNQWQSINLQNFAESFKDISDSVKNTDNTLTYLAPQSIFFYDGSNSTGYGSWGGYDIFVRGSNFLGSSPRANFVRLTDFSEKYELNGSINISNTVWGYGINGGTFSSLSHTNSSGIKDYVITGSFTYSALGTIDGATITSVEINQSNGKLLLKGTLNLDANEVITGGTITSISYTAPDGKSFAISNILLNVADLQSILQGAGSSSDFSTLSSFFLNSANLTGNDSITGDSEANILDGAGGIDTLIGGLGDDTYIVDLTRSGTTAANFKVALQDTITETAVASSGTDTVQLRLLAGTDYSAMANATTLTLGANLENLDASLTADTKLNLTGNALANTLTGNNADNILDGGAGVDTLIGGDGDDTYVLDLKTATINSVVTAVVEDTVTETGGTTNGIDTIKLRGAATLATATTLALDGQWANAEILDASATGSTKLNLTANNNGNTLIGNAAANILIGGNGHDILNGGAGIDTMIGGNGNDTYIVDNIADVVTETNANQVTGGTDLVKASVSYTLGANIENLELTGTAAINGTGNAGANVITGNTGNNILDGGAGIDTLIGGKGNDTYIVDHIGDVVTELLNEGIDQVNTSVSYTLAANVENLLLTGSGHINGIGNEFVNTITGNAGSNILDGGDGIDKLIGGNGDDTYIVDLTRSGTTAANFKVALQDTITETAVASSGTDTVQLRLLAGTDYSLMANATTLTLGANLENLDASLTADTKLNLTGNALANTLTGNDADNILDGGAGVDTLIGGEGDDTYVLDLKTATINSVVTAVVEDIVTETGGTTNGIDTIKLRGAATLATATTLGLDGQWANAEILDASATGSTKLNLTANNNGNTLIGNAAANILIGGNGHDTLNGGAGIDTMVGGNGNDTYIVDNINDVVTELASGGTDEVQTSVSYSLALAANVENLTLTGIAALNATGNDDANIITGNAGNNILDGKGGVDTLVGGKGNDTYIVDDEDDEVVENFNEGIDLVKASASYTLSDNLENLTLTDGSANGGDAAINGTGNALANTITGNAGNNILDGGAGADTMTGGAGDDIYYVDNVGDIVNENANQGSDLVNATITYTLGSNLENLTLTGSGHINATGNALSNTLIGNTGNNTLDGGAGTDTLTGGAGDDTYILDLQVTGSGDSANVNAFADTINETNGTSNGIDSIRLRGSAALTNATTLSLTGEWANIENLDASATGSTRLNLTGNNLGNTLIGNAAANTLTGGTGNDILNGGAGIDTMIGGAGNDIYIVDNINDVVTELANGGTDEVQASVSYSLALAANVENLTLTGIAALNATGNDDANIITGNAGNNILDGKGGADTLVGGKGNDTYIVDDEDDEVVENFNEGIDLVKASASYTISDNLENLTLTDGSANGGDAAINGTGNALANTITGNAGDNILDGGDGADKLIGGAGDDTCIVDLVRTGTTEANYKVALQDTITETAVAGSGTDTVKLRLLADTDYSLMANATALTLAVNLENLDASLTGATRLNLTGNALANTLTGNDADNILDGGAGVDTLIGGKGDDTYILDLKLQGTGAGATVVIEDTVIELNGTTNGIDTIKLRGTAALATATELSLTGNLANIEILDASATGNTKLNLTGNDLDNTLIGNAAANIMIGGDGNDIYIVDNTDDIVIENDGEGIDGVKASVSYTLSNYVENLTLTGTAAINATGNDDANIITGNTGNNILDGKGGVDTLVGGKGNDTYIVDDEDDEVVENFNEGIDLVKASASYTLSDNLENLTLTDGSANGGDAAINGTGNALANTITGNAGNNILDGGAGADTMTGGAGDDIYYVDNVGDIVNENANQGSDLVNASITYTLGSNLENLTLTGSGHINATGNALSNTLIGNAGNNTLDGGAGTDTLIGGAGDDTFIVDLQVTGSGASANVNAFADTINETNGTSNGIDSIRLRGSAALTNATTLSLTGEWANIENLDASATGSTKLNLTGNSFSNILIGNSAANIINGGAGADTMTGGAGDDIYYVDNVGDIVNENANQGSDLVNASITYTLGSNLENLTLTGSGHINATGNVLSNTLIGNAGNNTLDGGAGTDALIGGAGDDTYILDLQVTGSGDSANVNAFADTITETNGTSNGLDSIKLRGSAALTNATTLSLTGEWASIESLDASATGSTRLNLTGNNLGNTLIGNTAANTLTGGTGNDILNGGAGIDTMIGGAGDDIYYVNDVGDIVNEDFNQGTDLVNASNSYALGANLENLTLLGAATINGTGNSADNVITGNDADNILDGGLGADTLIGGKGNDIYIVDNVNDVVSERLNEGTDLVKASVTYSLSNNLENLILTDGSLNGGTASINGTGNALNNTITGNAGSNTLNGGAGNDILDGGAGTDILIGGAGDDTYILDLQVTGSGASANVNAFADTITETNGTSNGFDSIKLRGSAALTNATTLSLTGEWASIESLDASATGSTKLNLTGNNFSNILIGNSAANIINGGAGADIMTGGAGDDIYYVDNVGDIVNENANQGSDLVNASITYTLGSNLENLTLTGSGHINATGNALSNIIIGNAGNNTLDGGAGTDTLIGGAGDDTYILDLQVTGSGASANVNAFADTITETNGTSNGLDSIKLRGSAALTNATTLSLTGEWASIENLDASATGSTRLNILGNANDNILIGNQGSNTIKGGEGNDYIDGGGGADIMIGGKGDDTYIVDHAGDQVDESFASGAIHLIAINASGLIGNSISYFSSFSTDGRYVLFGSMADNLIDGDTNSAQDYFLKDLFTEQLTRVSLTASGAEAQGIVYQNRPGDSQFSKDGNYILFTGYYDNMAPGVSSWDGVQHVYLKNLLTGDVKLIDQLNDTIGNGDSFSASISSDNRYVLFTSLAGNLGTDNSSAHLFLKDLYTDKIEVLAEKVIYDAKFMPDNGSVLFSSSSDSLVANDTNGQADVFIKNLKTGEVSLISTDSNDIQLHGYSSGGSLSSDGRYVAFSSTANFTGNNIYQEPHIYVKDLQTGTLQIVSTDDTGTLANGRSTGNASISSSGRYVVFTSDASNLVNNDTNRESDVFIKDIVTGQIRMLSYGSAQSWTFSNREAFSADEQYITFQTNSDNPAIGDNNGSSDAIIVNNPFITGNDLGIDTVKSSINYTLTDYVENLVLTGTANINGNGNNLDNIITGNIGNNSLNGAMGNDTMIGGAGNDTLTGGLGADTFVWNLADKGTNGIPSIDKITDFNSAEDKLDLRDLLVGESSGNILNYLDITTSNIAGVTNTEIRISNTGGFTGGNYSAAAENQHITLAGVNLLNGTNEAALLANLISQNKLVIDA